MSRLRWMKGKKPVKPVKSTQTERADFEIEFKDTDPEQKVEKKQKLQRERPKFSLPNQRILLAGGMGVVLVGGLLVFLMFGRTNDVPSPQVVQFNSASPPITTPPPNDFFPRSPTPPPQPPQPPQPPDPVPAVKEPTVEGKAEEAIQTVSSPVKPEPAREIFGLPPQKKSSPPRPETPKKIETPPPPLPTPPPIPKADLPSPVPVETGKATPATPVAERPNIQCVGVAQGTRPIALLRMEGVTYTLAVGEEASKVLKLKKVNQDTCVVAYKGKELKLKIGEGEQ